jgi:hypothetical protein
MHRRRLLWQCKDCALQTSATAGMVMHGTHTPLRTWLWAAYLVATHHPGISAKQLQRQLGLSRYETAWLILQKLRRAMVAPEREPLKREVEIDEFWLGGYEEGLKGSRQRGKTALVGVAIEVRGAGSGRLRLAVLPDSSGPTLRDFTNTTTEKGAIVHTDGLQSYRVLAQHGYEPPTPASGDRRARRAPLAARPPSDLQPQGLDARHPPRGQRRAPARLPRRVRLSPQPPRHSNRGLPDPARPRRRPPADDLPPDHPPRRLTRNGINRIRTIRLGPVRG